MKKTILIVDDSYTFRSLIKKTLQKENYTVIAEAKNGIEGFELYEKYNPDIVLTDINMPKMNGHKLIEKLVKFNPKIKIMAILTFGNSEDIEYVYSLGALSYINKPFQADFLFKRIESMFQDNYQISLEKKLSSSTSIDFTKNNEIVDSEEEIIEVSNSNLNNNEVINIKNNNDIYFFNNDEIKKEEDEAGFKALELLKQENDILKENTDECKDIDNFKIENKENIHSYLNNKRHQIINKDVQITEDMNINDLFFNETPSKEKESQGIVGKLKGLFK